MKADEIVVLKSGLFAIISQVYTSSLHSTTISAFVVNLDITASIFQINLKCPDEVSYVVRESNDVIPPQHLKKFTLIISDNLKSSQLKCDLQVVNTAKKVVASRSIVLSKGHRCVCAWHCRCACDNHDHLRCEPLSLADYNRAGYLGQLPIETKGSSRFYITFLKYVICFFECLMVGGIMKAIGSLLIPSIGTFGLWFLFPNKAKGLKHYNEDKFRRVKVIYDEEGFPIHPVKHNRNVRFMPWYKQFAVNCLFFILALISNITYHHRKHKNYFSLSPSNSSSGHTTTYRYSPIEEGSILGSKSKNGSEDHLAEKYVSNLIDAYHVYRNLSRPLGGVNCVPGTPYSVCGIFSKNVEGKYEFTPTPPFKQYWMMDRSPIKPGIELNPEPFCVTFNTAEEVLLANDITQYPRSIVINMISSL
uniref:Generative cell specific-1/HAP2 domain-containing protein n=2 Tax=Clastoptera arizonana TaxID=38151 RepID=A0A1B6CIV1_9HEMI